MLNPGDSFDDALREHSGVELLVLPVMAPFLTELQVMEFARALRPGAVLPVHDGYARDFFLEQRYDSYQPFFDDADIRFYRPGRCTGDSIEL